MVKNRLGETRKNNQGLSMTIIAYENSHNMTVKFEDNTILYKKYYGDFKKGMITNPNYESLRIRKKKEEAKNRRAKIKESITINGVEYKIKPIDNKFYLLKYPDGTTRTIDINSLEKYISGELELPKSKNVSVKEDFFYRRNNRIGEKQENIDGDICEIVEYKSDRNITVLINNSYKVSGTYYSFVTGKLRLPEKRGSVYDIKESQAYKKYVGKTVVLDNGLTCKCIDNKDYNNITVVLSDNSELVISTTEFNRKHIRKKRLRPDFSGKTYNSWCIVKKIDATMYECKCLGCNRIFTRCIYDIINGKSKSCVDCVSKLYKDTRLTKNKSSLEGKNYISKDGFTGIIESYIDGDNITIRFLDNSTKLGTKYNVEHGLINPDGIGNARTRYYNGYKLNGVAFRLFDNIDTYYYCIKDGKDMVLRPCDMV